jgi:hypothetical protein
MIIIIVVINQTQNEAYRVVVHSTVEQHFTEVRI